MRVIPSRRRREIIMLTTFLAAPASGLLLTACGIGTNDSPARTTPAPEDIAVEQLAHTSTALAPYRWVAVTSDLAHAIPADIDATAGRVEQKSCGAPAGDTTGMGGPVEWRVVPTPCAVALLPSSTAGSDGLRPFSRHHQP